MGRVEDAIWNRACLNPEDCHLSGDRALADMLLLHGLIMNGGVFHALEALEPEETTAALAGYAFFGLVGAEQVLSRVRDDLALGRATDAAELEADQRYSAEVPDDSSLAEAFELAYRERPQVFAPV